MEKLKIGGIYSIITSDTYTVILEQSEEYISAFEFQQLEIFNQKDLFIAIEKHMKECLKNPEEKTSRHFFWQTLISSDLVPLIDGYLGKIPEELLKRMLDGLHQMDFYKTR